jgi:hypothetical protein
LADPVDFAATLLVAFVAVPAPFPLFAAAVDFAAVADEDRFGSALSGPAATADAAAAAAACPKSTNQYDKMLECRWELRRSRNF